MKASRCGNERQDCLTGGKAGRKGSEKNTNAANVEKNPCHAPWDEIGQINTECAKRVFIHLIPEQVS